MCVCVLKVDRMCACGGCQGAARGVLSLARVPGVMSLDVTMFYVCSPFSMFVSEKLGTNVHTRPSLDRTAIVVVVANSLGRRFRPRIIEQQTEEGGKRLEALPIPKGGRFCCRARGVRMLFVFVPDRCAPRVLSSPAPPRLLLVIHVTDALCRS